MKKTGIILALLLCCAFLCACGKGPSSPYLTEEERSALDQGLAESIVISYDPEYPQSSKMTVENNSDHTLSDFWVMRRGSNTVVARFFSLSAGEKAMYSAYSSEVPWDKLAAGDPQFYFRYSVGAYAYTSDDLSLQIQPQGADASGAEPLEVLIETENGTEPLELNGKTEFSAGTEIEGLSAFRIYSLTGSVSYSETGDYYYSLSFDVEGKKPSSGTLAYKLLDTDDVIWDSGSISFYSGDTDKIYISPYLKPGTYTLLFEEYK